ncbi:MAG: type II toxin-antitoxin system VapC family toxin [Candidatus Aminicenantes bacterium]|nr:MAG: type II toxin-antitoxin system VapC family toxin [Candidatus Aminicenantes bacterium]
MTLLEELSGYNLVFLDTAPIIYYIEANDEYGPLMKEMINRFKTGDLTAFTSVITITEVLPKPVSQNQMQMIDKFLKFLRKGKNINLLEISPDIAELAGRLRGKYDSLRTMDAIQVSAAIRVGADAFITNDVKLKRVNEVKIVVLKDYLNHMV